jgi:hypothetical protein
MPLSLVLENALASAVARGDARHVGAYSSTLAARAMTCPRVEQNGVTAPGDTRAVSAAAGAGARTEAAGHNLLRFLRSELGAFIAGSTAAIAVPLAAALTIISLDDEAMSLHGWVAIVLGSLGSAALAVGLMAVMFASERTRSWRPLQR